MSSQNNVNSHSANAVDGTNPAAGLSRQQARALRRHESLLLLHPVTSTRRATNVEQDYRRGHAAPIPEIPLETVVRSEDLWFEDGDVIIWAQKGRDSLLYRVHCRVLKESGVEPFCTVVNCNYPNPETPDETFLDGVWVLKYDMQDPIDVMYVLKWIYERPSISKRSTIPFLALKAYLDRSEADFVPAMRRCALEYLWNMFPTNLNYHQRVPTLVEDCYSEDPVLFYKPHVLYALLFLSKKHQLVTILPMVYYHIAQWPLDWITDGIPADCMEYGTVPNNQRFQLPQYHAIVVLAGREKLIRMRETTVFNFMEGFTSTGMALDIPTLGCDGAKRPETGETCFEWLMRVWFFMSRLRFPARPSALEIMNMGQWAELQKNCCEACGLRVMEHMLEGRDGVWKALPGVFGCRDWDWVVMRQKAIEQDFEAEIS